MGECFEVNISGRFSEFLEKAEVVIGAFPGLEERLRQLEATLADVRNLLVDQRTIKEHYTVEEVAEILNRSRFTVREWCRHGRIRAAKGQAGRGAEKEWRISHEELLRYQNEGLLPLHR